MIEVMWCSGLSPRPGLAERESITAATGKKAPTAAALPFCLLSPAIRPVEGAGGIAIAMEASLFVTRTDI